MAVLRLRGLREILAFSLSAFCGAVSAQENGCGGLLKQGIYDYFRDSNVTSSASAMRSEVSRAMEKLDQDTKSSNIGASYGLFSGSVSVSAAQLRAMSEAFSQNISEEKSQRANVEKTASVINGAALDAWRQCVDRYADGLRVSTDAPDDPFAPVSFTVRYVAPPGVDQKLTVYPLQITEPSAFSCSWAIPAAGPKVDVGRAFQLADGNSVVLDCLRKRPEPANKIVTLGGRSYYALPARISISTSRGSATRPFAGVPAPAAAFLTAPTPIGTVLAFAGTNAPPGWKFCDGSSLRADEFKDLFEVLSYTYGGDPSLRTFLLPDLRGRFVRGLNGNAGMGDDRDSDTSRKLGSLQPWSTALPSKEKITADNAGNHEHGIPKIAEWNFNANTQAAAFLVRIGGPGANSFVPGEGVQAAGQHTHNLIGGEKETRPANVALNFIIHVGVPRP